MASEERNGILPLGPLSLRAVPLTTHNIAWSPDAELAIASDDSVYLYLPEFPSKGTRSKPTSLADLDTRRQYYEVALRFPAVELRVPELNRPLFKTVKQDFPDFEWTWEAGQSLVANNGSSLNHVVSLEWSPSGLGRMKRSVLGVLTGSGTMTIYCEGIADDVGGVKIKSRNIRTISSWVVPWGVGGNLLLPRAMGHDSPYSMEHITSFAWARDLDRNGGLLAYMNDEDEIVILSVQAKHAVTGKENHAGDWRVEEAARFPGSGPHEKGDVGMDLQSWVLQALTTLAAIRSRLHPVGLFFCITLESLATAARHEDSHPLLHGQELRRLPPGRHQGGLERLEIPRNRNSAVRL